MRAALFAIAALAAGARARLACDIFNETFPEPCAVTVTSTSRTAKQLARAAVGSLWFTSGVAVDAFATPTDGTIVLETKEPHASNGFSRTAIQAQVSIEEWSYETTGPLLQQRELPACDAPVPVVTRAFPRTACPRKSSAELAPKGCGVVVISPRRKARSPQELATGLVGTLRFVFDKGASALQTTTEGQVVLVLEEEVNTTTVDTLILSHSVSMGSALPTGTGKLLSGPQTCTELRDSTLRVVESKSESTSSAHTTVSTAESNKAELRDVTAPMVESKSGSTSSAITTVSMAASNKAAEASQASAAEASAAQSSSDRAAQAAATQSSSARRAAVSAVWTLVALAFAA